MKGIRKTMNKQVFKRWLPLVILLSFIAVVWLSGMMDLINLESIKNHRDYLQRLVIIHPVLSVVVFTFIYTLSTALSLPIATVLTLVGGFLFGRWFGTLYVVLSATLGASIIFAVAKSSLGAALREKAGSLYKKIEKDMEENAVGYMFFMRLVPLFPFFMVNILPALFNIRFMPYFLTTFFGIIPGSFVYVNVGRELGTINTLNDLVSTQTLVAFSLLGLISLVPSIYKHMKGKNMSEVIKADICVIGGGSGGLSVAAGAVQLGLKTVLIEAGDMGGDCLNTGCVPSKALLAAAKRAQMHRRDNIKGIAGHEPEVDFAEVKDHVLETIQAIEPNDSKERFEGLGVTVINELASFVDKKTVKAGEFIIKAKNFVIATGSHAVVPPIKGLDKEKVYTNENIFPLSVKPEHLLIIGGGPIGIEMAQAHKRLGCEVSVFDMGFIMPHDEQCNVEVIRKTFEKEGISLLEDISIDEVKHVDNGVVIKVTDASGNEFKVSGSHLLVAAGRKTNMDGLDLEKAGVKFNDRSIIVDKRLRTSNKHIFAIGDVSGSPQFTHVAGYHAGIVIRNVCFKLPAKVDYKALPWVTYSDPELAQVGLTEEVAYEQYGDNIRVIEQSFKDNDRAIAERATKGQLKVITDKKGKILGASMVGKNAGELIGVWGLAISSDLKIGAIANMIIPYPTMGEISKRAAGAWYTDSLFSDRTRRVVRLLQKLPF